MGGQPGPADAWYDVSAEIDRERRLLHGVHVTDGSYVMNVGELQINITNHGLLGSQYTVLSSWADAPSGQWPAS